jgi:hypothetical protein
MMIKKEAFEIIPEYGPYLVWIDIWTDGVAAQERREWFWDRYMYRLKDRETTQAIIYPRDEETGVSDDDIRRGVTYVSCLSCDGSGVFSITDDDEQKCVVCRGTGEVEVSV